MTQQPHCAVLLIACSLLICACSTTGDPNQGGLFGWRENQAQQRQESLHTQIEQHQQTTGEHTEEYRYLRDARQHMTERVDDLDKAFQQLLADNQRLQRQIQTLLAQQDLADEHLQRLRSALAESAQVEQIAGRFEQQPTHADRAQWVHHLQQLNDALRESLKGGKVP